MENQEPKEEIKKKNEEVAGPIVGSIIIILVLILGGIYLWKLVKEKAAERNIVDEYFGKIEEGQKGAEDLKKIIEDKQQSLEEQI